jgi:hypothetical protein
MNRNAVREWIDTIGGVDMHAAQQVQRALDASLRNRLPEPEVIESDWGDLMPMDRALFGAAFQDTQPPAQELA